MTYRSQKLFLIAGIFGLVLLGKPAKTSASTVDILTSNIEDLAAVGSPGETNDSRADLPGKDEETPSAETTNSVDRTLATKAPETGLFNQGKGLAESIGAEKTDLDADRDSPQISNPVASKLILPTTRKRQCRVPTMNWGRDTALPFPLIRMRRFLLFGFFR